MRIRGNRLPSNPTIKMASRFRQSNQRSAARRYSRGACLFMATLALVLGIMIRGSLTDPAPASEALPTPVPASTKIEYRIQKVPTLPTECQVAIEIVLKMEPNLASLTAASTRQLDILSEANIAMLVHDVKGMTRAGNDQNQLSNDTADARRSLNENLTDLRTAMDSCNAVLGGAKPLRTGG